MRFQKLGTYELRGRHAALFAANLRAIDNLRNSLTISFTLAHLLSKAKSSYQKFGKNEALRSSTSSTINTWKIRMALTGVWLEFDFNSGFKSIVILKGWLSKTGFWARIKIDFQPLWFQFLGASTD